jgi:hypothetical protein
LINSTVRIGRWQCRRLQDAKGQEDLGPATLEAAAEELAAAANADLRLSVCSLPSQHPAGCPQRDRTTARRYRRSAQPAGTTAEDQAGPVFGGQIAPRDNAVSTPSGRCATLPFSKILTVVFILVTIVVPVFPVTTMMVMFAIFVPFSIFAAVPLTIVPEITVQARTTTNHEQIGP